MGALKHRQAFSFQIGLCSEPHMWSWILVDDWKNTIPSASGRDRIFAKSYEYFTVWHFATKRAAVKFVKLWISSHFFESRDPNYAGSAMRTGEASPARLPYTERPQWLSKDQVEWTTHPTLLGPVLVWSQQNYYLRLLLPVKYSESSQGCCHRDPPDRKSGNENKSVKKWMNEFFTPVYFMLLWYRYCSQVNASNKGNRFLLLNAYYKLCMTKKIRFTRHTKFEYTGIW